MSSAIHTRRDPAPCILPAARGGQAGLAGYAIRRSGLLLLSGVFLFASVLRLLVFLRHPTPRDDAFIVFRVARNLANGLGFVFNEGERLQSVSSPLYGLFAGGMWWLLGDGAIPALQVLGLLADSTAAILLCVVVSSFLRMGRERLQAAGLLAGVLYAGCSSNVLIASNGLETGFYTCAIAATFLFLAREKTGLALVSSAVCGLLRPEGFLVALVVLTDRFRATRRLPWREATWLALAALPYAAFAIAYYGSLEPQTVVAKDLVARSASVEWRFIAQKLFLGGPLSYLLGTSVLVGALTLWRHRSLPPWAIFGLAYVTFFSSVGSWWPWYFPPALLAFFGMAGIGLAAMTRVIALSRDSQAAFAVAAVVASLVLARDTLSKADRVMENLSSMHSELHAAAEWVNRCTAPTVTVMLEPLGIMGYYADRRVEDYPGLASRRATDALKRLHRPIGAPPLLETRSTWWDGSMDPEALRATIDAIRPEVLILTEIVYRAAAADGLLREYEVRRKNPTFILTRASAASSSAMSGAGSTAVPESCQG